MRPEFQRVIAAALLLLLGDPAAAHIGHIGEVAGHDHLTGLAALAGAAALVAAAAIAKARRKAKEDPEPEAVEPAGDAAEADAGAAEPA